MSNSLLFVRKIMGSDLGWFAAFRTSDITKDRQNGLDIDSDLLLSLIPDLDEKTTLPVEVYYWEDGETKSKSPKKVINQIRYLGKKWRLEGEIEGQFYSTVKPGDYLLMFFKNSDGKTCIYWDLASPNINMERSSLFQYLEEEIGESSIIHDTITRSKIMDYLKKVNIELHDLITNIEFVKQQVKKAFSSRHILVDIMSTVVTLSSTTQIEYLDILERIVERFRYLLRGQILSIDLNHKREWDIAKGKKIGFIDGGVASISSLGSEPIAIRVGEYTVRPGVVGEERETFNFKAQLVNELYDNENSIFDEFSDNFPKLLDMARIFTEAGAVYKSLKENERCDLLFLHGPLVNPAAPYADFPKFTNKALELFGLDIRVINENLEIPTNMESHFIAVYRHLLESIFNSEIPVCGIVERSSGSRIVSQELLEQLAARGFAAEADEIKNAMKENRISDSILFSCLLKEGEYIKPLKIDKNDLRKSPDKWKAVIDKYPKPLTTYLKASETSYPFRVELNKDNEETEQLLSFIYHMARLLPQYAFPVGLDIADKFAKVPAWMSKQISKEQSAQILNTALASGRSEVVDLVRLYLSGNSRDWLFRPKFDR